jgi:hypothetical protein
VYGRVSPQNVGQNQKLLIANKSFDNVAKFKYMETTATTQNYKRKRRAEYIRGMLSVIPFRMFFSCHTLKNL